MRVIRAEEIGMCFGVRDALQTTRTLPNPTRVTIRGELVHNSRVTKLLDEAGFRRSPAVARGSTPGTPVVLITAHGVSRTERRRLAAAKKELIDTTCPLVRRAHEAAQALQAEGRHVLVIGQAGHVEVQGIVEDLDSYEVVGDSSDVGRYESRRLGVVCQTTVPTDAVADICACLRRRNPRADIRLIDTVCQPTKLRQAALLDLLPRVNAVVVVGGRHSNNTRRLAHLCHEHQIPTVLVEGADELDPAWFDDVHTVGLTAGTSTLDETVDDVHRALERIGSRHTLSTPTRETSPCES